MIFNSLPAHIQRSSSQSIHSDQIRLNFQDGVSHRTRDSENPQMSNRFLARENQMFPDLTNQLYEKLDDSGSIFNSVTQEAQKNAFNSKIRRSADFANGRTGNQIVENRKTTCMLYLQVSHLKTKQKKVSKKNFKFNWKILFSHYSLPSPPLHFPLRPLNRVGVAL